MSFNSINRQFKTTTDFAAWLATLPPPAWHPVGSTYHNTYRPTEAQWRGKASMDSMQADYISKGWASGPHCYLALHSPNPADNGIWVMTPPTSPGTHAGECNPKRFGIEVVGDFQSTPPAADQQQLLVDVCAALHHWSRIGPDLNAHRDCMSGRTCPGDAFYALKPQLQQRLAQAMNGAGIYRVRHTQAVFEAPEPGAKVALNDTAEILAGADVDIDEVKNGWAHIGKKSPVMGDVGFIPVGILSKL